MLNKFSEEYDIPINKTKTYARSPVGCQAIVDYMRSLDYNINYWELPKYQDDSCDYMIGFGIEYFPTDPTIIQLLLT